MRFLLGVDEAGRGPLAGPIAVGIVSVPEGFDVAKEFPGVADSKKLSVLARERIYKLLRARAKDPGSGVQFCVRFGGNFMIDERGISPVTRHAVARGVRKLAPDPRQARVLLDGSLYAPREYPQVTIIGGDDSVPLISLASIAAKVSRDRLMRRMAKRFPAYGFERHMGYGTKEHTAALKKFGLCEIHRRTFIHIDFKSRRA